MAILNFSDVLKNVGLDPRQVKLIRHSLADKGFNRCYEKGMITEYTRVQSDNFSDGYDYWCVFISDKSTTARFFACYKVNGSVRDVQEVKPNGFPLEGWFQGERMFYTAYESWHTALSSVNAVYLIVDRENGRQYVGSAYGKGGLLGRWTDYVDSLHGGNKLMKELLCDYPERYTHFQFSILQLLPKAVTPEEVIHTETLWKQKLLTYEPRGMNAN